MKKLLLILLCVPLIGVGQSFEPTYCECAKAFIVTLQLQGFQDKEDLEESEIKTINKLEEKYSNCEKYIKRIIGDNDGGPIFQGEFIDCILDDTEYSDLCKCKHLIGPRILEAFIIAFSTMEIDGDNNATSDDAMQKEREKFWEKKIGFCQSYVDDMDDGELNWVDEKETIECERRLLNEVLGNTTASNKKESVLYGEINDPDGYTNVREDKSSKSDILFKVYKNKRFKIIDNSGNWWIIEYNGQKGYMYKDKIDVIK